MNEWINSKDRLPEKLKWVACKLSDEYPDSKHAGKLRILYLADWPDGPGDCWYDDRYAWGMWVSWWFPLPEVPIDC